LVVLFFWTLFILTFFIFLITASKEIRNLFLSLSYFPSFSVFHCISLIIKVFQRFLRVNRFNKWIFRLVSKSDEIVLQASLSLKAREIILIILLAYTLVFLIFRNCFSVLIQIISLLILSGLCISIHIFFNWLNEWILIF
jgi:hypothetical protein